MDDKKKIIVAAVLIGVLLLAVFDTANKLKKKKKMKESKEVKKTVELKIDHDYDYISKKFDEMEWERDPFGLVVVESRDNRRSGCLKGIMVGFSQRTAIFGNMLLKAGDKIKGYKILEIKEGSVILSDGKLIYELKLGESLENLR